ncbi:serine/threonine-protein kinase [Streptomyces cavernae]|uniref:serine/threonine-protein kinase n=1 Tax=Streptomyces cavernae TaxID=2259034 RepID=UPI000FEB69C7|nr:serine/threonine-protein kinase [Streptomyces cavernae]
MRERVISGEGDHPAATRSERGSGQLIAGRYLLRDILGRGGMGTVWRAHDQLLDRPVAAKELHVLTDGDEEHRRRLRRAVREARAVARVPHPHVVGVHDLVDYEGRLWMMMELIDGPSLARVVTESGPLTPQRTAAIGLQLLDALAAVHAAGALHRDVKPANVLLRPDGNAVLTDFGIADLDDGEFLTTTGELVGSIEYMAPERMRGEEAGPSSDLWSLGATLATVCCGRSPFRRPGHPATLHAVVYEDPQLSDTLGPLRPVVEALLRKFPDERPSPADAAAALRQVAGPAAPTTHPATLPVAHPPTLPTAHPEAYADTLTVGRRQPAPAGETWSTAETRPAGEREAWSTAGTRPAGTLSGPAKPEPAARNGRRRLAWAAAGTVLLVTGVGAGLYLADVPPFAGSPVTTTVHQEIRSKAGWQYVDKVPVQKGDKVTVRFKTGSWTVDHRSMPMTGPAGYDAGTDKLLDFAKSCKVKASAPFGALLVRLVGEQDFPVRVVGRSSAFRAAGNGTLQLRINDGDNDCLTDNKGALKVSVTVTRRP